MSLDKRIKELLAAPIPRTSLEFIVDEIQWSKHEARMCCMDRRAHRFEMLVENCPKEFVDLCGKKFNIVGDELFCEGQFVVFMVGYVTVRFKD